MLTFDVAGQFERNLGHYEQVEMVGRQHGVKHEVRVYKKIHARRWGLGQVRGRGQGRPLLRGRVNHAVTEQEEAIAMINHVGIGQRAVVRMASIQGVVEPAGDGGARRGAGKELRSRP